MKTQINTKPIPIIITLAAAFIACVMSIVQHVEFSVFVARLLVVVVIFLFMGTVIKLILDYAFRVIEPPVSIDAEVPPEGMLLDDDDEDAEGEGSEVNSAESEEG
ncbi:hypothetical protein [Pseudobutyrivibrio xylanivorans]|uniref:Uncharacterized protein n=1 Tax=Pseudobutyrivibrio xylanivorans TaxID=185007 RepID=A0A5P6VVJ6_PSEXY|nr:hypothetical protein [Pseudobutyrivibrio xylanivorans]QFJ55504.1 hypothetical protein FXF36_11800 [Pseudobutyrivibrio xylanivorans]